MDPGQFALAVLKIGSEVKVICNLQNAAGSVTDFPQRATVTIMQSLPQTYNFYVLAHAVELAIPTTAPPLERAARFAHFNAVHDALTQRLVKVARACDDQHKKDAGSRNEAAAAQAKVNDKAAKDKAAKEKAAKDKAAEDSKSKHTPKTTLKANAARLRCWKCGKSHSPDDCTLAGKVCFGCGSADHMRVDCDKPASAGNGGAQAR